LPVTVADNRNVISGTPEFRKDYYVDPRNERYDRDVAGSGVGPGIRIMDPGTSGNLVQSNYIGTDVTGTVAIPNHNGIEIMNGSFSNWFGNQNVDGTGNLIRFNVHDGIRVAAHPNVARGTYVNQSDLPDRVGPILDPTGSYADLPAATNPATPPRFFPTFYDLYTPNYFVGQAAAGTPQIIQMGVPDSTGTGSYSPGVTGAVGTKVTINGSNFTALTSVTFTGPGGTLVPAKFDIQNDQTVVATVPNGAVTGVVRLFSPGGTAVSPLPFTLAPSPEVILAPTSVFFPASGKVGETITINGSNYIGAQTVSFGNGVSTNFTVNAAGTQIQAVIPFGATSGPITIQTPGGSVSTINNFILDANPPGV
jgi:hypothetical protein